jgi:hypothetical protein
MLSCFLGVAVSVVARGPDGKVLVHERVKPDDEPLFGIRRQDKCDVDARIAAVDPIAGKSSTLAVFP